MVKRSLIMSQIQVLSTECSEDARKVEHALHKEETLKQVAADEKTKHLEVIQEVEQAKRSFTREAYSKHKAEMVGGIISVDKEKVVDSILSASKNCRRYSKHEIELATDNFSEARKIGEGGYGNVYRCTLDHIEVAVKTIQQDSTDRTDEFLREVCMDYGNLSNHYYIDIMTKMIQLFTLNGFT
jgi:flagellar basal body L-ring protein FlgH